jgi:two-component system sensor histidine kinase/response regulator
LRVLVVEDNPNNQQVVQELLVTEGARVSLAGDGEAALAAIAAAEPAFYAVLMDLQMPVLDGIGATQRIRSNPRWRDLPIIAMTANALASDRTACLAAGMNDHVGKPFDLSQLVATLRRHTARSGAARSGVTDTAPAPGRRERAPLPQDLRQAALRHGIDVTGALAKLGGHIGAYRRLAQTFAADLPSLPDRLDAVLSEPERAEACRLMHSTRGVAATLGMAALSAAAAAAEQQFAGASAAETERLASAVRAAAEQAQAGLAEVMAQLTAAGPDAASDPAAAAGMPG